MPEDPWVPKTVEERLDRVESVQQIQQLPYRYAQALDSRNFDAMVELFIEDVQVGRALHGREALKRWFGDTMSRFGDSIHFVGNHVIDFDSPEKARGVVYCHDELEMGGQWNVGFIQYWDEYEKRAGRWYFRRRRLHRWYMVDALERPRHGARLGAESENMGVAQLPDAWPSWGRFWKERGQSPR